MLTTPRTNIGGNLLVDVTETFASITNNTSVPYLQGIGTCINILRQNVQSMQTNKDEFRRLSEKANEFLKVLINFEQSDDGANVERMNTDIELRVAIEDLGKRLEVIAKISKDHAQKSVAKRAVRQEDDRNLILDCEREIKAALDLFQYQLSTSNEEKVSAIESTLSALTPRPDQGDFNTLSPEPTYRSIVHLPPKPPYLCGRDTQLSDLVQAVLLSSTAHDTSRASTSKSGLADPRANAHVLLGPLCVGKSCLALHMLYHRAIEQAFGEERYFMGCDGLRTMDDLKEHIVTEVAAARSAAVVHDTGVGSTTFSELEPEDLFDFDDDPGYDDDYFRGALDRHRSSASESSRKKRALLVLDNIDAVWEPLSGRAEVEALLSRLASIQSLTLVATLRGLERPGGGVRWSKLPPLLPLGPQDARELLLRESGVDVDMDFTAESLDWEECGEEAVDEILQLCAGLPLLLHLFGGLMQSDSAENLLHRWRDEGVMMFGSSHSGSRSRSDLAASIALSVDGARMRSTSEARELLSVAALFPGGMKQDDLPRILPPPALLFRNASNSSSPDRAAHLLRQAGLASRGANDERSLVLAPMVRDYVFRHCVPSQARNLHVVLFACDVVLEPLPPSPSTIPKLSGADILNLDHIFHHVFSPPTRPTDGAPLAPLAPPHARRIVDAILRLAELARAYTVPNLSPTLAPQHPSMSLPLDTRRLSLKSTLMHASDLAGSAGVDDEGLRAKCLGMAHFWGTGGTL